MNACRFLLVLLLVTTGASGDEPALRLHAAGSLREVMTELTQGIHCIGWPARRIDFRRVGPAARAHRKGRADPRVGQRFAAPNGRAIAALVPCWGLRATQCVS